MMNEEKTVAQFVPSPQLTREALTSPRWKAMRKTAVTLIQRVGEDFVVQTLHGPIPAKAGDYLALDPGTGDIWPIKSWVVNKNYEPL